MGRMAVCRLTVVTLALLLSACSIGASGTPGASGAASSSPGSKAVPPLITNSSWTFPTPGPCEGPSTITLSLKITGGRPGDLVLVSLTGPGLPGSLEAPLTASREVTSSYPIPRGSGVWLATIISIGGKTPQGPADARTLKSSASCTS